MPSGVSFIRGRPLLRTWRAPARASTMALHLAHQLRLHRCTTPCPPPPVPVRVQPGTRHGSGVATAARSPSSRWVLTLGSTLINQAKLTDLAEPRAALALACQCGRALPGWHCSQRADTVAPLPLRSALPQQVMVKRSYLASEPDTCNPIPGAGRAGTAAAAGATAARSRRACRTAAPHTPR